MKVGPGARMRMSRYMITRVTFFLVYRLAAASNASSDVLRCTVQFLCLFVRRFLRIVLLPLRSPDDIGDLRNEYDRLEFLMETCLYAQGPSVIPHITDIEFPAFLTS